MKYAIAFLVLCASLAYPDFKRTSGLIDIPTARIMPHLGYRIGTDVTLQIGQMVTDYDQPFEENLHSSIGLGDFLEIYFDVYTIIEDWTVAGGFCHRVFGSDKFAIAWGIHSFSTLPDMSEVGQTDTAAWHDDFLYSHGDYEKPYERYSGFVVSSYALAEQIDVSLGFGRGRYVGYGAVSKYLNSNLYHEQGGDWGIGVFGGVEYKLSDRTSLLIEGDGRDINAGIRFQPLPWEFGVGVTKIEYIFDWDEYRPRIALSASYKHIPEKPGPGIIAGTVRDTDGNALVAAVRISESVVSPMMTEPEFGAYQFTEIEPALYELTASAEGYSQGRKKVEALADQTVYCDFILERLVGGLVGIVIDNVTEEPLAATVMIVDTDAVTESDVETGFAFMDLEPATYTLNAEAVGYHPGSATATVEVGTTTDVLIRLEPITFALQGIQFDFDKSTLRPVSIPILEQAADVLRQYPNIRIEIQGHTCWLGSDEYNLRLSQSRANSVMNYLVTEQNIDKARLTAKGYGETTPVATNETKEGRERNRRVEFVIIK
ncbi:MAG: OmpA family protein [candidate division WOR-3 bacterium]|nr:MAG: OmpA family protein [candidate division WOR-3 bacterium]